MPALAAPTDVRTVAIIDYHPLVRELLGVTLAKAHPPIEISYSGPSITEAVAVSAGHPVSCIILDLDLNDGRTPVANVASLVASGFRVLVISALTEPAVVRSVLSAGAWGYVGKNAEVAEILRAVEATMRGEAFVSQDVAAALYGQQPSRRKLSTQEERALVLFASGMTIDSVACTMGVSPSTVQTYIKRVRVKFAESGEPASTKVDLHRRAQQEGYLV